MEYKTLSPTFRQDTILARIQDYESQHFLLTLEYDEFSVLGARFVGDAEKVISKMRDFETLLDLLFSKLEHLNAPTTTEPEVSPPRPSRRTKAST